MDAMILYSSTMLRSIAAFLGSEPIIYIFALICLSAVVKVVKNIIT